MKIWNLLTMASLNTQSDKLTHPLDYNILEARNLSINTTFTLIFTEDIVLFNFSHPDLLTHDNASINSIKGIGMHASGILGTAAFDVGYKWRISGRPGFDHDLWLLHLENIPHISRQHERPKQCPIKLWKFSLGSSVFTKTIWKKIVRQKRTWVNL